MNRKTILFSLALGVALCAAAWSVDLGADFPSLGFARGDALNFKFDALNTGKAEKNGSSTQTFAASELHATTLKSAPTASTAITLGSSGVVSLPNQSYVRVASESIPVDSGAATTTLLVFVPAASIDTQGEWSGATFTAKVSGVYAVNGRIAWPATGGGSFRVVFASSYTSGGVAIEDIWDNFDHEPDGVYPQRHSPTGLVFLNAGEKISFRAIQDSGTRLNLNMIVRIAKIH